MPGNVANEVLIGERQLFAVTLVMIGAAFVTAAHLINHAAITAATSSVVVTSTPTWLSEPSRPRGESSGRSGWSSA